MADSSNQPAAADLPDGPAEGNSGEYVVVARRYRPQNFGELVGQNQVSQALGNAIATNRVGHAYLFTGARGVGKTSAARIFAKALDCVTGPTSTPCGQCDICQGIAAGEDVDVIEIDGASNRGIDEIRQLRSNVNVRPSRARFKIYIIDEVHMLTNQAFNALLKTLEEPPEHVKFIFCTTEADKIPITVLSRCQRFDFAPIETKSILGRLEAIVQSEGVTAQTEALQILARRAAGSMRDSQSLLEQLLSFGGKTITVEDVHSMLGTAKCTRLAGIATALVSRDAAGALREVDAAVNEGVDLGQFAEQLVGYFRDVMAAQVGCSPDLLLHSSPTEMPQLQAVGNQLGLETLLAVVQILDQSLTRMRHSTHVRTLLEIALVRVCKLEDLDQLSALIGQVRDGVLPGPVAGGGRSSPAAALPPSPAAPPRGGSAEIRPSANASAEKKTNLAEADPSPAPLSTASQAELTAENLPMIWKEALASIEDMTADFASKCDSVAIFGPNRVVVRFRKAYNKEQCQRPERKNRLEQALSQVAGVAVGVEFELLAELPGGAGAAKAVVSPVQSRDALAREARKHPLVKQAVELFDAVVDRVLERPRPAEAEDEETVVPEAAPAETS